jgi:serine/threonine protein kinase
MTFDIDGFSTVGVLGKGGFGTVYRASDDVHGRDVAVKVLARIDDDSARRRFDRERRAMGTLSGHPNIGIVYTSGFTSAEEPYIVMELIRGGSLADRLDRDGQVPAAEVVEMGVTLAEALQHAHDGGVLHLDLKPENILISQFGRPKIVDFGISALVNEDSRTSTIRATPAFADPSVLEGNPGTVESDVYGLAATLYTLLMGTPPYADGPSGMYQVMRRVALAPVPRAAGPEIPDALGDVLQRAMSKSPTDRPHSMAAFAGELRESLVSTPSPPTRRVPAVVDERAPVTPPVVQPRNAPPPTPLPAIDPTPSSPVDPTPPPPIDPMPPPTLRPDPPRDPNRGLPRTPAVTPSGFGDPSGSTPRSSPPAQPRIDSSSAPSWVSSSGVATPRPRRGGRVVFLLVAVLLALAAVAGVVIVASQGDGDGDGDRAEPELVPLGQVPGVIDLRVDEAREVLDDAGYAATVEPHCFDRVERQRPAARTELDAGGAVELLFPPCTVPMFTGLELDEAIAIVDDVIVQGLQISWPGFCNDEIVEQDIEPGTVVDPGTTVNLTMSDDC